MSFLSVVGIILGSVILYFLGAGAMFKLMAITEGIKSIEQWRRINNPSGLVSCRKVNIFDIELFYMLPWAWPVTLPICFILLVPLIYFIRFISSKNFGSVVSLLLKSEEKEKKKQELKEIKERKQQYVLSESNSYRKPAELIKYKPSNKWFDNIWPFF